VVVAVVAIAEEEEEAQPLFFETRARVGGPLLPCPPQR
jgi:hypothetical protein